MAGLQTRKSALAVVTETTEGTPVAPSASSDYLPIQEDVSIDFSTDTLENAELRASIGTAQPILGQENPTASFSLYLKGSGTSGTEPAARKIYKAAFGAENVKAAEYDAEAGSTVSDIVLSAGQGADYGRGYAVLVQHAAHAWELRPVHDVNVDTLKLAFNLNNTPVSTTLLGRPVTYYPAEDTFDTLTIWNYLANGGAIEMLAGARPTALDIEFSAGEIINQSLSFEAVEQFFDPIEVTSNNDLDFTDDDGTFAVSIESRYYKDPHEVAEALTAAMNASGTTETHSVTYDDSAGKFVIATSTSTVLSLLWNTGANTATTIGTTLGFSVAADDTGSTSYTADNAQDWSSPQTPVFQDVAPNVAKSNEVWVGDDSTDNTCINASNVSFSLANTITKIPDICADSGVSGSIVSQRAFNVTVTALLSQHDAANARRFRKGDTVRWGYAWGPKDGGNWVKGKCGVLYLPFCTVTNFSTEDQDGLVAYNLELQAYVSDSSGEGFLSTI